MQALALDVKVLTEARTSEEIGIRELIEDDGRRTNTRSSKKTTTTLLATTQLDDEVDLGSDRCLRAMIEPDDEAHGDDKFGDLFGDDDTRRFGDDPFDDHYRRR